MRAATVYLVGAGPGDLGLITVKGRELLRKADAVVFDYLVPQELVDEAPCAAERVYVGKKGFSAHVMQDEVNELLARKAREVASRGGSCVVRLKGGDPFVFGRGGEEAAFLSSAGVPFEIVPGVTSGVAGPAYAGIPVTHRGIASTVTFVTGHEDPSKKASAVDWGALARLVSAGGTVCFYMGMRNLETIATSLCDAGVDADMPVAVVHRGTEASQRTVVSSIERVANMVEAAGLTAPAIILVGRVASMRGELSWFEKQPLFGKRLVVTRARAQASGLVERLRGLGADVLEFPVIECVEPDDCAPISRAMKRIGDYDWIVFTSANGVDAFFRNLVGDARALAGVLVAAIGPATAKRLQSYGIIADAMPEVYRGEAVFGEMKRVAEERGCALEDERVLIPRAQEARKELPVLLRSVGAHVDVVAAYKTVTPTDVDATELATRLESGEVDGVTFTSSSTVRNCTALLGERMGALNNATLFSIGPITSSSLRQEGFQDIVEARKYTVDGLIEAIVGGGL